MRDTTKYGQFYWCAKVVEDLARDREIYLMADEVRLVDGALSFVRSGKEVEQINLLIAPGKWLAVYAASLIDGSAVAVEHWAGEVIGDYDSIHSALKESGVPQAERNELEQILDELPTAAPEERPSLLSRGVEWLKRNGPAIGALSDQIRSWLEYFK